MKQILPLTWILSLANVNCTILDFVLLGFLVCNVLTGYMQPVLDETQDSMPQYYTEGGLVCNCPLHCFDGKSEHKYQP